MRKELSILKGIRTRLLNKNCETMEEFEIIQDKLNKVELQIKEVKLNGNINSKSSCS